MGGLILAAFLQLTFATDSPGQLPAGWQNHDQQLEQSLDLASKEAVDRKDIYGHDALAWALFKNGRYVEASDAIDKAMKPGTQDAMLYYHAGMIEKSLGRKDRARSLLRKALSINPRFDLLQSRIAEDTLQKLRYEYHLATFRLRRKRGRARSNLRTPTRCRRTCFAVVDTVPTN